MSDKLIHKAKAISMGPRDLNTRVILFNCDLTAMIRYYAPLLGSLDYNYRDIQKQCIRIIFGSFHLGYTLEDKLFLPPNKGGLGLANWKCIIESSSVDLLYQCINSKDHILQRLTSITLLHIRLKMDISSNFIPALKDRRTFNSLQQVPKFILHGLNTMKLYNFSLHIQDDIHLLSGFHTSWTVLKETFSFLNATNWTL